MTQPNKDFPLDCETLDMLQTSVRMAMAIGLIAGDKVILEGCKPEGDGTRRTAGYVFMRTAACPEGEVLHYPGGAEGDGVYVKEEYISVTSQGYEYKKAYTRRQLSPGQGNEHCGWEAFTRVLSFSEMTEAVENMRKYLEREVAKFREDPLGIVKIWAGGDVPDGFMLCDGRQLRIDRYEGLYRVIGTQYNEGMSANGTKYATDEGYFRLPDLRSRFVVGYNVDDEDYKRKGMTGGAKQHTLSADELPAHSHKFKDYYYTDGFHRYNSDNIETNEKVGSKSTDFDNGWLYYYEHETAETGNGHPHESRPPYYSLAYIIRVI